MGDKFDPYREALIMETVTIWPDDLEELSGSLSDAEKQQVGESLHADPEACSELEYVRTHTGFCRQITVTSEDFERVKT